MNRSFRAAERPVSRGRAPGVATKDKEEELALFREVRKHERERNTLLLHNSSDDLDPPPGSRPGSSPLFKIVSAAPARKAAADDFLNSDNDKNDYDWLLTPPGTPLFPSLDKDTNRSPVGNIGTPKTRPTMLKSRLANPQDPSSRNILASRQPTSSSGLNSSAVSRRPSSSGGPGSTSSRPATPSGRPTLPATSKASRPSTPTSRATVPSRTVAPPPRSSTPSARSSTPTSRPSVAASSRPASRSSTPTRRPSTPTSLPASSGPPGRSSSGPPGRSSSGPPGRSLVTRSLPATSKSLEKVTSSKSSAPSRGTSPTVKSRPWKPSDMPGFSFEAPTNLRTSLPERSSSASRGRAGAPSPRSSSVEATPNVRSRRQSCSPSRGRAPNGNIHSGSSVPAVSRSRITGGDNESPVLIGSKMVERVVNVRRLAPPMQEDKRSTNGNLKSSSSPDSSGFGRTLSKKSLDMALRHMDIRRSIPNNLRPLMTKIPASSMYSVRSGSTRGRVGSISDSPLATSSNASSEPSVNNSALFLDGSEIGDDDINSEKGGRFSPAGLPAR